MRKTITQEITVCDFDDDNEAIDSFSYKLNGYSHTIDVCAEHHSELCQWLPGATSKPRKGQTTTATANVRQNRSQLRQWAIAKGYEVAERGRIPADVLAAYEAAHK